MPFPSELAYQSIHGCVSCSGLRARDGDELAAFLTGPVAARFDDTEGRDEFNCHMRGLELTGMGLETLEEVLSAEVPEERLWAASEALAEAVLEEEHDVIFPWNAARDKRNPFASLAGADIVGVQRVGGSHRLALGEIKSSSEARWPPQVMSARSPGLPYQIEALVGDVGTICQLLKWLVPRVRRSPHAGAFDQACTRYLVSGRHDVALFGMLVRDQDARDADLRVRADGLAARLQDPTRCHLIALYLPWPISGLPQRIRDGGTT